MAFATRLRRLLQGARASNRTAAEDRIGALERALATARGTAQAWKDRASLLALRDERHTTQLHQAERGLVETRARLLETRHEVLAPSLVRQSFAQRVRTLAARTRHVAPAERERCLMEVSPAYRAFLTTGAEALGAAVHRMMLDGLNWRFPVQQPEVGPSQAWIDKQRFPYHGILQTRELAIGGVMLDLGANIGRMAIPRVVLGDVTAVYCAEPDPVSFACLAANVIDNGLRGLVLPDQTAIGDREGLVLLRRAGESGGFHVVPDASADGLTVEVPCTTLDKWVERLRIDLDAVTFIKVDVEGFERRLVSGASHVLAHRQILWQMEIKPAGLRAAGDVPSLLYGDLRRSFTHFVDMNRKAAGSRVRPIEELEAALQYIEPKDKTDVLLFTSVAP